MLFRSNSEILDYGCGAGSSIEKVIKFNPKKIVGIDISEVSINKAKKTAEKKDVQIDFKVDNCEKTKFENNTFDIVYGSGILHHLQLKHHQKEHMTSRMEERTHSCTKASPLCSFL